MKKNIAITIRAMVFISACSTSSKNISASHISPLNYQAYNCDQLTSEMHRINDRVIQLGGRLDSAAANDFVILGLGIAFWPALFALGGKNDMESEYAYQKGVYKAVETATI